MADVFATSAVDTARRRYEEALRHGRWRSLKSRVLHRCNDLLPARRVLDQLDDQTPVAEGVMMIPIERIVGSAGRHLDFDLAFVPRNGVTRDRWQRVAEAIQAGIHLPPIRVLKIGEVYLVEDGNHRVSVSSIYGREAILADVYALPVGNLEADPSCTRLGYKV